jgi:uncharacterized cofD-like protein
MQKIVTIGGGAGQFQILRGLKHYDCDITAIVTMCDDGGLSTKRLRDEHGVLPPGDVRQCLIALADDERAKLLRKVFGYRFSKGTGLSGHNLGNLIITALSEMYGDVEGIKEAEKLLGIRGKVLPVTIDKVKLYGEMENGEILEGQAKISYPEENLKIKNIFYQPEAFLYREVKEAIKEADKIVVCPGDFYGSILSNFVVKGMAEALKESKAKKIYVCNLVTKQGTFGFKASNFVKEIEKYSGIKIDKIIINGEDVDKAVKEKYLAENSVIVEDDLGNDTRIIRGNFVGVYPSEEKTILRHIPEKIAREIIGI